jgi:hypothetical protein
MVASAAVDAKPFAHELALLKEAPQRDAKLLERLRELPVAAAVELLHELIALAESGDVEARIALASCVGLSRFEDDLGYEHFSELYLAADGREYEDVKRLLSRTEVKKRPPKKGADNELVQKTLGERTQLARTTRDRDLLDKLCRDKHPRVIANLLLNPRIVERDVVLIAAMRPTSADVLEEIVRNQKWIARYAVKKALAMNPYFPVGEAVTLLALLDAQDLQETANLLDLAEAVRETAREILARRSRTDEESN